MDLSYGAYQGAAAPEKKGKTDLSYSSFTQAVNTPPKPSLLSRVGTGALNFAKSAATSFGVTAASAPLRFDQAIISGAGALSGDQHLQDLANQPITLPGYLGGGTVGAQKNIGQGGVKQIAGQSLDYASYLAPAGRAEALASNIAKGTFGKAVLSGAAGGAVYGTLGGAGGALQSDNATLGNVAKQTAIGGAAGAAGGAAIGLGGAALARVVSKVVAAKTPSAVETALREETNLPEKTIQALAPPLAHVDDHFAAQNIIQGVPGIAARETSIPEHLQPLAEEAKKYKTAEEFANSKVNAYHGSPNAGDIQSFNSGLSGATKSAVERNGGTFFSNKEEYAKNFAGKLWSGTEGKSPGVIPASIDTTAFKKLGASDEITTDVIERAKKAGFKGIEWNRGAGYQVNGVWKEVKVGEIPDIEYIVFDNSTVKTRNELKSIHAQATDMGKTPSKIGKSIEANAIEDGLTKTFGETAGYDATTIKEQSQKIADLMQDQPRVDRIIDGIEKLPPDIRGGMFIKAIEDRAVGDGALLRRLAKSPVVGETSIHASEMRFLAERNPDSPVSAIQDIVKARAEKASKTIKNVSAATKKVVGEIQDSIRKNVTPQTWSDFVDSITC